MGHLLVFSCLEFSCPHCSFVVTVFSIDYSFFLSPSLTTSLPSKDLFLTKERFSLDFTKFSISRSFFRCACHCFLDCVVLVCLERKWTYQCSDSSFFVFLVVPIAFLGEEIGVLMSRSKDFLSPYLLLCRHCVYVVDSRFFVVIAIRRWTLFFPCHWPRSLLCKFL